MVVPLPHLPIIRGIFINDSIDGVASYFRGYFADAMKQELGTIHELAGKFARVKEPFGPDSYYQPNCKWLPQIFPLRGMYRISTVRSNSPFVLVETFCNVQRPYFEDDLRDWTGADVYTFYSLEGNNPMLETPEHIHPQSYFPSNGFLSVSKDTKRYLGVTKEHSRWHLYENGPIASFEDPENYTKRRKADRMNRAIIFDYMSRLGIDPLSVFERRELDHAILFTSDHAGQSVEVYETERLRYDDWVNKKFGLVSDK